MSKFTRHEIVMNGANLEGKLQRTLVLDSQLSPRHVFKLNKHFLKRLDRTSQMAYATDFLIESTADIKEGKLSGIAITVYRLSGPCSNAGGRPQLFRIEADREEADMVLRVLRTDEFKTFRQFLMVDDSLDNPLDIDPEKTNAVLPTFLGWDGEIGITEEKQSAYVIDLLGGAPVHYAENIAFISIYSRRQFIMPFDTHEIPNELDFDPCVMTSTPGITLDPNPEINWVVFHVNGGVSIVENKEEALGISRQDIATALKLYIEPFLDEDKNRYGLLIEVYSDKPVSPFYASAEHEESDALAS